VGQLINKRRNGFLLHHKNDLYRELFILIVDGIIFSDILMILSMESIINIFGGLMAIENTKQELFDNFVFVSTEAITLIESTFNLPSSYISDYDLNNNVENSNAINNVKAKLEQTDAWQTLSKLYDYAVEGVIYDGGYSDIEDAATDLVIGGSEIISVITSEQYEPSREWDKIITMGDGRFSLDTGGEVEISKLALLADVDIRTVRNSVSAGELISSKVDNIVYIANQSALSWLGNRRAFKPTKFITSARKQFADITTAFSLGIYLQARRNELEINLPKNDIKSGSIVIKESDLAQLESGVFNLPLYAVDCMADFYQIPKDEFLTVIMKVFFPEHLHILLENNSL
jgi:hypothetical protein